MLMNSSEISIGGVINSLAKAVPPLQWFCKGVQDNVFK
jgi:hypothetical protein